jgi:hypothetical protein
VGSDELVVFISPWIGPEHPSFKLSTTTDLIVEVDSERLHRRTPARRIPQWKGRRGDPGAGPGIRELP